MSGDETQAWAELLRRYQDRLYGVCVRMVGNREVAADLTQDSMVKIIQGLASYDSRSKLSTWMIRVAMNTCLSYLRGQKHRRHASLEAALEEPGHPGGGRAPKRPGVLDPKVAPQNSAPSGGEAAFLGPGAGSSEWREQTREHSPHQGVELEERRQQVAAALAALPHEQRAILVLRDVQGLDYDQIGVTLNLAVGTVKSRLFRARIALREAIENPSTS